MAEVEAWIHKNLYAFNVQEVSIKSGLITDLRTKDLVYDFHLGDRVD